VTHRAARSVAVLFSLTLAAAARPAAADSLTVASPAPRHGTVMANYHVAPPAIGRGTMQIVWTDGAGRLVMRRTMSVNLGHGNAIPVRLAMRRAVVMANRLEARLAVPGRATTGAAVDFVAVPDAARGGPAGWDYPIIAWQDQTPARAEGLRGLGITAGRVFGARGKVSPDEVTQRLAPLLAADLRFYVENIATDFYAAYHRFRPDLPVTWAFDQARAVHARDPADLTAFQRHPSLSDPHALSEVRARLTRHVRLFAPYRPLYYSLGDETGIADLAAAWDFDVAPESLAQFRRWLRSSYGTLAALNRQWGTDFADWGQIRPILTDQAIAGSGENFSGWVDFKAFMDDAFAGAVRAGTMAVHAADPTPDRTSLAAIEGAQVPGWGGYDYARLAQAVDVMEIYDAGNNVEIALALNPLLTVLTTTAAVSGAELAPAERGRLWHELLLGNRGLILWDEAGALVDDAGRPTALGRSYATLFDEFHDGLADQLGAATPAAGPVAILYSPPSFRIDWLLARREDARRGGADWSDRSAETEGKDTPLRASMRQAAALLTHIGLTPRWVSDDMLERGLWRGGGVRVLLLPRTIALSDKEIAEIRAFVMRGGRVLADGPAGLFDDHGRRRPAIPLADSVSLVPGWWDGTPGALAQLADRLRRDSAAPPLSLAAPDGTIAADIDVRVRRDGTVTLIGMQRDPAAPTQAAGAADVVLTLARPGRVYDLRSQRDLGWTSRIVLPVGMADPAVLAVSDAPIPPLAVTGPRHALAGTDVVLRVAQSGAAPAAERVVHVQTLDPDGMPVAAYSGNLRLRHAPAAWLVPLAVNDREGIWTVRIIDRLGADTQTWRFAVGADPSACVGLSCGTPAR
jgi:hypothetical protein